MFRKLSGLHPGLKHPSSFVSLYDHLLNIAQERVDGVVRILVRLSGGLQ